MQLVGSALALVALAATPSLADDEHPAWRVGLRAGIESSSTVRSLPRTALLVGGIDADHGLGPFVIGGELTAMGGPFDHGTVGGGLRGGVHSVSDSLHAMAGVALGLESITHICAECDSVAMPYGGLRGELGYAFPAVEIGAWAAIDFDLGRDHVSSSTTGYDVGGFTFGGGVTLAVLSR